MIHFAVLLNRGLRVLCASGERFEYVPILLIIGALYPVKTFEISRILAAVLCLSVEGCDPLSARVITYLAK